MLIVNFFILLSLSKCHNILTFTKHMLEKSDFPIMMLIDFEWYSNIRRDVTPLCCVV